MTASCRLQVDGATEFGILRARQRRGRRAADGNGVRERQWGSDLRLRTVQLSARRALTVDRQLVLLPGREPYLAPPKTAASVRTVPLPRVVVNSLAAHLAGYPPLGDGFVFTTERGRPLRRTRFSAQAWQPAVAASGLPAGTHFHDLRHFYASLLIRHGESVKVVQARLGHASAAETLDTYSLWPDSDDRTARPSTQCSAPPQSPCRSPARFDREPHRLVAPRGPTGQAEPARVSCLWGPQRSPESRAAAGRRGAIAQRPLTPEGRPRSMRGASGDHAGMLSRDRPVLARRIVANRPRVQRRRDPSNLQAAPPTGSAPRPTPHIRPLCLSSLALTCLVLLD